MMRVQPKKTVNVDSCAIMLGCITASLFLWAIPLIRGKYAAINYLYIADADIINELVTVAKLSDAALVHNQLQSKLKSNLDNIVVNGKNPKKINQNLPSCPIVSPFLQGLSYDIKLQDLKYLSPNFEKRLAAKSGIEPGGFHQPSDCNAQYAVSTLFISSNYY